MVYEGKKEIAMKRWHEKRPKLHQKGKRWPEEKT